MDNNPALLRIMQAIWAGDPASVAVWLAQGKRDPRAVNLALSEAAQKGQLECLRLLLPWAQPQLDDSAALLRAARQGHVDCLEVLLPVSDMLLHNCRPLQAAALHGRESCVAALLRQHARIPEADKSLAFRQAASRDHLGCLNLLLPWVDPRANDSVALLLAAKADAWSCVQALAPMSDVPTVWAQAMATKAWSALNVLAAFVDEQAWRAALDIAPRSQVAAVFACWEALQLARAFPVVSVNAPTAVGRVRL